jgi:hypothetical protein
MELKDKAVPNKNNNGNIGKSSGIFSNVVYTKSLSYLLSFDSMNLQTIVFMY